MFNDTVAVDMIWAGKAGELQWVNNGVATLRVEGIHSIQLKTTQSSSQTTLHANRVDGSELRVMIENEAEAGTQTVWVGSLQSPALSSIILNGSASQDDLVLAVDSSVAAVKQIAMTGGSGDDTLIASAAMNTFTGGKGADVFDFSASNSAKIGLENKHISALNTITDFSEKDSLKLANSSPLSLVQFGTGDLPADLSLEAVLSHEKVTDHSYLHWNNHTYLILTAALNAGVVYEGMEVIKLVGIHD